MRVTSPTGLRLGWADGTLLRRSERLDNGVAAIFAADVAGCETRQDDVGDGEGIICRARGLVRWVGKGAGGVHVLCLQKIIESENDILEKGHYSGYSRNEDELVLLTMWRTDKI